MRVESAQWTALNSARVRHRRYALQMRFDPANAAGDVWIVSHGDVVIGLPGTVIAARIKATPVKSQTLQLDKGSSTIGNGQFEILDVGDSMTTTLRDKLLTANQGLRGKEIKFWSGFQGLAFDQWALESTQISDADITYSKRTYKFSTRDALGQLQVEGFEPVVMNLAQPIDATTTTIPVYTTAGLLATERGTSYSDGSTPGQSYAYVEIEDEIIRIEASGILPTSLINVQRGALATRAVEHSTDETKSSERGKEVREVVYLELPWPKLALAVLTGALYNQTGTLPPHHHAGVAGAQVDINSFLTIGLDFYNPADDTQGVIERWVIRKATDIKRFVERMLAKYGVFLIVDAEGQFRLKRPGSLLDGAAAVAHFTCDAPNANLTEALTVRAKQSAIQNNLLVRWNEIGGDPTRSLAVQDTRSIARHGLTKQITVDALGWAGSRLTEQSVLRLIGSYLEYYAGIPLETDANTLGSMVQPEIGDIVRVSSKNARDYTSGSTISLDRSFLIINKRLNLRTGKHSYKLFASTSTANAETPISSAPVIPDAWYFSAGVDLVTLPGVVDTGTEVILPDGLILTGGASLASSIYYSARDLRIPAATTTRWNQNVQIRCRGNVTIEGDLGAGDQSGLVGVSDNLNYNAQLDTQQILAGGLGVGRPAQFSGFEQGFAGYYGITQADGGIIEMTRHRDSTGSSRYRANLQSVEAPLTVGQVQAIPNYVVRWDGSALTGLPDDLRGTSGGPGGGRYWNESREPQIEFSRGGTGGAGGPGLLIVARGVSMGVAGRINSSGLDGANGNVNPAHERPAWSGAGAGGAPGAVIMVIDGATGNTPVLTDGNVIANYGDTRKPTSDHNILSNGFINFQEGRIAPDGSELQKAPLNRVSFYSSGASGREAGLAAVRFFFALGPEQAEVDADDAAIVQAQQISAAVVEAYSAIDDSKVTAFKVTITRVSVTVAYAAAAIYVRPVGRAMWEFRGFAEDTLTFTVLADGVSYEVQARPALLNGREATTGFFTTIASADADVIPVAPNSLQAFDMQGGDHLVGQVPFDIAAGGYPRSVLVYQSSNNSVPDTTPIAEVELAYDDSSTPRFIFGRVIADTASTPAQRWYWIRAANAAGTSARYPAGTGIPAAAPI